MTAPHLSSVGDDGPFVYPVPPGERLDGNSFVKWHHLRWLASETFLMASFEAQGMARALFDLAQTQGPPGTLPRDMGQIARMLRVDPVHFDSICRHPYGPMRGWKPCVTASGAPRLYHPVVLEQVLDALERREAKALANTEKAVKARQVRMIAALRAMGCNEAMFRDDVLITRMEQWLTDNWKKRREGTAPYERVLLHAQREGWLGPRRGS